MKSLIFATWVLSLVVLSSCNNEKVTDENTITDTLTATQAADNSNNGTIGNTNSSTTDASSANNDGAAGSDANDNKPVHYNVKRETTSQRTINPPPSGGEYVKKDTGYRRDGLNSTR